jgi:hypothetical protein
VPSHKREKCTIKAADRAAGMTRTFHPDWDRDMSNHEKAKVAAAATTREATAAATASSAMSASQAMQYPPWPFPGTHPPPMMQTFQGAINPWQQQQQTGQNVQAMVHAARLEHDQNTPTTPIAPVTAAAQPTNASPCPYPACQAILPDQHVAQEHMRMFHSHFPTRQILCR